MSSQVQAARAKSPGRNVQVRAVSAPVIRARPTLTFLKVAKSYRIRSRTELWKRVASKATSGERDHESPPSTDTDRSGWRSGFPEKG